MRLGPQACGFLCLVTLSLRKKKAFVLRIIHPRTRHSSQEEEEAGKPRLRPSLRGETRAQLGTAPLGSCCPMTVMNMQMEEQTKFQPETRAEEKIKINSCQRECDTIHS